MSPRTAIGHSRSTESLHHTCATVRRDDSRESLLKRLRVVFGELFDAVDDAVHDQDSWPDERIKRASDLLRQDPGLRRVVMAHAASAVKPESRARSGLTPWRKRLLRAYIEKHLEQTMENKDLAILVGLSESHFCRAFKDSFGDSPHRYISRLRIDHARRLLLTTTGSLGQIAIECGFADQAHFCKLFRKFEDESPGAWRRARLDVQPQSSVSSRRTSTGSAPGNPSKSASRATA